MADNIDNRECTICCCDETSTARCCVYCVTLLMCAECRTKLGENAACPQCRRRLSDTAPDLYITSSRPCKHDRIRLELFDFRIIPEGASGSNYVRIGTKWHVGFDVYARLSIPHTLAHIVYLRRGLHRSQRIRVQDEYIDSKEALTQSVALTHGLQYLDWQKFLTFLLCARNKGVRMFRKRGEGRVMLMSARHRHLEMLRAMEKERPKVE